jgi:hypothetical protein
LAELLERLSGRDMALLELVGEHRYLTTRQLEAFCFFDHASTDSAARSCRRVLARLESWSLVERPIRRVGGTWGGSVSSIWMLTSVGQRLRSMRAGLGYVGRVRPPGERFIAHYLAIAEARLALVMAERSGQLAIGRVQIEPTCWRSFTGLGGAREILKPDMAAVTALSRDAEYEDHWFIEIDRGTESLPTLMKQCRLYEVYRRTGVEESTSGVFPLVLWVVPDEVRAGKLRAALAASSGLDQQLYRVTTPERFIAVIRGEPSEAA